MGCPRPDSNDDRRQSATPTSDPSDSSVVDSAPVGVPWVFAQPWLEGGEWLPDRDAQLFIANIPPGSDVEFFWSEFGFEPLPCEDPGPNGCIALVGATSLGQATADTEGLAQWTSPVASLMPLPRVLYFQAQVTDPTSGATTLSTTIQRHVSVPADSAAFAFQDVSNPAGVAGIFTTGNSHTDGVAWPDFHGESRIAPSRPRPYTSPTSTTTATSTCSRWSTAPNR
jgi:hypothetical protein